MNAGLVFKIQRMKKLYPFPSTLYLALIAVIFLKAWAGTALPAQELRTVPVTLSLWNPIATTPYDSLAKTHFNLGFQSTTHRVNGVAVNVLGSVNRENVNGTQLSLFSNVAAGEMTGLQASLLYNATGQYMRGVQFSAIQNTAVQRSRGVQVALMSNFVIGDGRGVQLSGLANIAGSRFRGFQLCAGVNLVSESVEVVQLSAISNICADTLRGVQFSLGNYASVLKGVQIGLLNMCAGEEKGIQIGLVNRSADTSMVKVGLVNINPKTRIAGVFYGSNTTKLNFAVRFTNNHIYTMLGIGSHYYDLDADFSGSVFYRAGYEWTLIPDRFFLSSDLGYAHIENFQDNERTPRRMFSVQARFNAEYLFTRHLGGFASVGYAYTRSYKKDHKTDDKPIVELGVVLRK